MEPVGTGTQIPAGSLVTMQIHYNLLRGDKPVRSKLVLHTVPGSTPLQPLHLALMAAPPDIPCPTGVTGPRARDRLPWPTPPSGSVSPRSTSSTSSSPFCGRSTTDPPAGNSTSCTWPIRGGETIVRLGVHMHLLGAGMKIVLNAGTPTAQTLLDVTNYNFDFQRTYQLATPVDVHPGDTIQVNCTYDPTLRQELPQLRKLPPRYVTWGDGSSDEMCLGLVWTVKTPYAP